MKLLTFHHVTALVLGLITVWPGVAAGIDLTFPTQNRALLKNDGPAFYMFTDRDFQGRKSTPWTGGKYGYVRTPVASSGGIVYTRFHEGVDIKPLERSSSGEPLDTVSAAASGRVVHASNRAADSNYGRYVVIEHVWDGSPYYSLYAHLNSIAVSTGQRVRAGEPLGRLGYTGRGVDRRRAHVHFEVNLMLNRDFERWHDLTYPGDPNHHGIYNGLNLAGMDPSRLLVAAAKNPSLSIPAFLRGEDVIFVAVVPATKKFLLPRLYPWMVRGDPANAKSWEISFTGSGLPVRIEPRGEAVSRAYVSSAKSSRFPLRYVTKGYVTGTSKQPVLTASGRNYLRLVSGDF